MTIGREVRDAFAACPEGYMLTFAAIFLAPSAAPVVSAVPSIHRPRGVWGSAAIKASVDPGRYIGADAAS